MAIAVFTSLQQVCDNNGDPLNGGTLTVYQANSTTPISLFSAANLTGAVANPIVLDSAGRHAMTYFAFQSYKVLCKNSGGSTLWTRDNIDPGIAIGTGDVAVVDGGTGASTAAGARTNLSAASAAELADLAADVAGLAGTLGSTDQTHIAAGTTAQRPASPIDGDIRFNIDTDAYEGFVAAAWWTFAQTLAADSLATPTAGGFVELATAAEMVTGTDAARVPSVATVKNSAGVAKAWAKFAGGTGTIADSYNITSVVRDSAGDYTVTIANDFATADYVITISVLHTITTFIRVPSQAAGSFTIKTQDVSGTDTDPTAIYFVCHGTLA